MENGIHPKNNGMSVFVVCFMDDISCNEEEEKKQICIRKLPVGKVTASIYAPRWCRVQSNENPSSSHTRRSYIAYESRRKRSIIQSLLSRCLRCHCLLLQCYKMRSLICLYRTYSSKCNLNVHFYMCVSCAVNV